MIPHIEYCFNQWWDQRVLAVQQYVANWNHFLTCQEYYESGGTYCYIHRKRK